MKIIGNDNPKSDDPESDFSRVQAAVNSKREVILAGKFNFGLEATGPNRRRTVTIPKGVRIRGEANYNPSPMSGERIPASRIIGGGEELDSGRTFGIAHCGAFKVANSQDNEPVVIQGIKFSKWKGQAILATKTSGLEVEGCRFEKPVPGTSSVMSGIHDGFTTAGAIFAADSECTGRFVARNNVCKFGNYGEYGEVLPWDEQFAACVLTKFSSITLQDNVITGNDDGIEVILNGDTGNPIPEILIRGNRLNLSCVIPNRGGWQGGNSAIACLNNGHAVTEICDNEIHLSKGHESPYTVVAFALSGKGFFVTNNKTYMDHLSANGSYPYAGLLLGAPYSLPPLPADLGHSFNDSAIWDNYFQGTAQYGIQTFETNPVSPLNLSHGITAARNNLGDLHAERVCLSLSQGTYENFFIDFPWSREDLGSSGTNVVLPVASVLSRPHVRGERRVA